MRGQPSEAVGSQRGGGGCGGSGERRADGDGAWGAGSRCYVRAAGGARVGGGWAGCCGGTENRPSVRRQPLEWMRRREAFLRRVVPTEASWRLLVASGARTAAHVVAPLEGAWLALMQDALRWVGREPGQQLATLWQLLLTSLVLHAPSRPASDEAPNPFTLAAREEALTDGDFFKAKGDRGAGIWRPGAFPTWSVSVRRVPDVRTSQRRAATARLTAA